MFLNKAGLFFLKISIIASLVCIITSCTQNSGPCEYKISEVKIEILSIEPAGNENSSPLYNIMVRFNDSFLAKEEQSLEEILPRVKGKINSQFIEINKIKKGDIYEGTVSEKISGNCQPYYVSFNYHFKTP